MAGSSFFALLDDIATILDDVAILSKVAAKKTAGVLGDDLALNAQQVTGVRADREFPVVWAVGVGSLKNKLILIPLALALSYFLPWAVTVLLMIGGAYLCFEGFEKIAHKWLHHGSEDSAHKANLEKALLDPSIDLLQLEKEKVKGAIRTDFVLSAEIIVIALGTVVSKPFPTQIAVLCAIGLIMTVGVYGFVAAIVKMDDLGLLLSKRSNRLWTSMGQGLLLFAPFLMKALSIVGTVAMFLVGGGILLHGIPAAHHVLPHAGMWYDSWINSLTGLLLGLACGALCLGLLTVAQKLRKRRS